MSLSQAALPAAASGGIVSKIEQALNSSGVYECKLSGLVQQNFAGNETEISEALTKKWIRNAVQRIFEDPHRWLLELAVNGVDACNPGKQVQGQFGMGFLSCLDFLGHAECGGTTIAITSRSSSGCLRITLSGDALDPDVRFERINQPAQPALVQTGTTISIRPRQAQGFSDRTLESLETKLYALDLQSEAGLDVLREKVPNVRIGRPAGIPDVRICLTKNEITIEDRGAGIPLETAATALLVPGISTKKKQLMSENEPGRDCARLAQWRGKTDSQKSFFVILVGGVVAAAREITPPVTTAEGAQDLIVRMPPGTRITLDRDEIILERDRKGSGGLSLEERYLRKVIDSSVDALFSSDSRSPEHLAAGKLLAAFYAGLRSWEDNSASAHMAGHPLSRYLKEIVQARLAREPSAIPVTLEHQGRLAAMIADSGTSYRAIALQPVVCDYDYSRAERLIPAILKTAQSTQAEEAARNGQLIDGKCVIFVDQKYLPVPPGCPVPAISSLGLTNTLFVPDTLPGKCGHDQSKLCAAIIYQYAESTVDLRPALKKERSADHGSLIARNLLVTNSEGERENRFNNGEPPSRKEMEALYGRFRLVGTEHNAALQDFWREYRRAELACDGKLTRSQFKWGLRGHHSAVYDVENAVLYALNKKQKGGTEDEQRAAFAGRLPDNWMIIPDAKGLATFNAARLFEICKPLMEGQSTKSWLSSDMYDKRKASISSLLAARSDWFEDHAPDAFLNYILTDLMTKLRLLPQDLMLKNYCACFPEQRPSQEYDFGPKPSEPPARPFVRVGGHTLWPLPADASAENISELFGALLLRSIDGPYDGLYTFDGRKGMELPHAGNLPALDALNKTALKMPHITLPHLSDPKEASAVEERFSDLASVALHQEYLQSAVKDLGAFRLTVESVGLCDSITGSAECPAGLHDQVSRLRAAVLHLNNAYLEVPDGTFSGGYDESNVGVQHMSRQPTRPVHDLLQSWPADNLRKLVDLQIDHAAYVLDVSRRSADIANKVFAQYHLASSSSPLGALAALREQGVGERYLHTIVDSCRDPAELLVMTDLLSGLLRNNGSSDKSPAGVSDLLSSKDQLQACKVDAAISTFLELFIREKLDPNTLRNIYETHRNSYGHRGNYSVLQNLQKEFTGHLLSVSSGASSVPIRSSLGDAAVDDLIKGAPVFRLTQLINAHLSDDQFVSALERGDLVNIHHRLRHQPAEIAGAKITHNIESATERSSVQAALMEPLQNSLDAIRSFCRDAAAGDSNVQASLRARQASRNKNHRIELDVSLIEEKEEAHLGSPRASLALEIRDSAGMPDLKTVLTDFLLPDYSRKSALQGNVGDMGNGLFQIYPDAAEVLVTTRLSSDPEKVYALRAVPLRDAESGTVTDLELQCMRVPLPLLPEKEEFFGTTLQVRLRAKPLVQSYMAGIDARHFIRETVGASRSSTPDGEIIPIYLGSAPAAEARSLEHPDMRYFMPEEIGVGRGSGKIRIFLGSVRGAEREKAVSVKDSGARINETGMAAEGAISTREIPGMEGAGIKIFERRATSGQSQVTTGGVPFCSLSRFCRRYKLIPENLIPYVASNLVLELPLGSYAPVQSRTDIKLSSEAPGIIRAALLDAVMHNLMKEKDRRHEVPSLFLHAGSQGVSLNSVMIGPRADFMEAVEYCVANNRPLDTTALCTYHSPDFLQGSRAKSFAAFIDMARSDLKPAVDIILSAAAERYEQTATENRQKDDSKKRPAQELLDNQEQHVARTQLELMNAFASWKQKMCEEKIWAQPGSSSPADHEKAMQLVMKAVIPWFEVKLRTMRMPFPDEDSMPRHIFKADEKSRIDKKAEPEARLDVDTRRAVDFVQEALTRYASHFGQALKTDDATPTVKLKWLPGASGNYQLQDREIGIDVSREFSLSDMSAMCAELARGEIILQNKVFGALARPTPDDAGVINHELEHWWLGGGGAHERGRAPDGQELDFEGCAASRYRLALQKGALFAWAGEVGELAASSGIDFERAAAQLRKLEEQAPLGLLKDLGIEREKGPWA